MSFLLVLGSFGRIAWRCLSKAVFRVTLFYSAVTALPLREKELAKRKKKRNKKADPIGIGF